MASGFEFPAREPSPLTVRQIHSGHSLSDAYGSAPWPGRLVLATDAILGRSSYDTIARSIIPGSPLDWRWENPTDPPDARRNIADFELLVTTETVPLTENPEWFSQGTLTWFDRWVDLAGTKGNGGKGAEVMLYSTWVSWRDGGEDNTPFRTRLDRQGRLWEQMQDQGNANRPKGMKPIYMIPGHRLMMRIYDDIEAGRAPGMTSISDLFGDDIHVNNLGQYAVTALVYATIYQRDPAELPDKLAPKEDTLTSEQARYFKKIAWEVVRAYPRSGVP
ncbi:MAG: hypothetical protein V4516_10125 [Pseudomonadota bacterium]